MMIIPLVLSYPISIPTITGRFRGVNDRFYSRPSALSHHLWLSTRPMQNPEVAFVRKKEQLYAEFWRTPKRSSVFPSGCEKAQIGFFKCSPSTLSQRKANVNPEGALVRSKKSLYAQFWRTPKRSSVLLSNCEKARIGFFKCGRLRLSAFLSEEWLQTVRNFRTF